MYAYEFSLENGPCPLIALVNILVLQQKIHLDNDSTQMHKTVMTSELVSILAAYLYSKESETSGSKNIDKVVGLLPSLSKGLDVNIQFDNIHGIESESDADLIFKAFEIPFVHGWVVNPLEQGELFHVLSHDCKNNYENAVSFIFYADSLSSGTLFPDQNDNQPGTSNSANAESSSPKQPITSNSQEEIDQAIQKAFIVNEFFNLNPTQMTPYGLQLLGESLADGNLAIMFRNNHFTTLFKKGKHELYTLCTDESLATDSRIVWETLNDVNQLGSFFVDSFFFPINNSNSDPSPSSAQNNKGSIENNTESKLSGSISYAKALVSKISNSNKESTQGSDNQENGNKKATSKADYVRNDSEQHKNWFKDSKNASSDNQLDSDYQYALKLQEQEDELASIRRNQSNRNTQGSGSRNTSAQQYRQLDSLPEGMTNGGSNLYGVPVVSNNNSRDTSNQKSGRSRNDLDSHLGNNKNQYQGSSHNQNRNKDEKSSCIVS
ncbi:hypothetical protein BB560_003882 [Smittium megazygosporum]|uniref:MINDY deubiquitinase domain-containing protein n=1 Tax=Smittium megazygosporum TaxID=133381 RepID=A0A2T9ZAR9_9FUNG|nr:hypothetical protein BB560_004813 [Smittium megazygosporum]PVV01693.1 hypothetical protein BB560_003882 [Smittium megazygosporum]